MKCHLAAAVNRSVSSLGLYLTAHALTVRDRGFSAACTCQLAMSANAKTGTVKQKAWSVNDKLPAIERVRSGESQVKVCPELSVQGSTLHGWLKDEEKLKKFLHQIDESDGLTIKRARTA